MAPSIGGIEFLEFIGAIQTARNGVEPFVHSGKPGTGHDRKGSRAPESSVRTVAGVADADVAEAAYAALEGTRIAVEDDVGGSFSDVMVEDVRVVGTKGIVPGPGVDPSATALVTAEWVLRADD